MPNRGGVSPSGGNAPASRGGGASASAGEAGRDYLQTLGRGLMVLTALKDSPKTAHDLCAALSTNRSDIYRILKTLEHHKFVWRTTDGSYALSIVLWELGVAAVEATNVRGVARRYVTELAERSGETVHLSVYDDGEVVYVDVADGLNPIRSYTKLGGRAPAYCVATGKVLLAFKPRDEWARISERGLREYTSKTATDAPSLFRELEEVLRLGVATNRGEWRAEVGGLAVPVRDYQNSVVAAIGVSGPVGRILENRQSLVAQLEEIANRISLEMRPGMKAGSLY